jgi:hypothetical protein
MHLFERKWSIQIANDEQTDDSRQQERSFLVFTKSELSDSRAWSAPDYRMLRQRWTITPPPFQNG